MNSLDSICRSCYNIHQQFGETSIKKRFRLNHEIKAPTVRLLGVDGSQIGIVDIQTARRRTEEEGYDLAEVSPDAKPPVVKMIDWGKYQYEQAKQESRARRNQKSIEVKQVRMGLKIGEHDMDVKRRQVSKFLEAGNKVKITARFKGREMARKELGPPVIMRFLEPLNELAQIEQEPTMAGRDMSIVVAPKKQTKVISTEAKEEDNAQA